MLYDCTKKGSVVKRLMLVYKFLKPQVNGFHFYDSFILSKLSASLKFKTLALLKITKGNTNKNVPIK